MFTLQPMELRLGVHCYQGYIHWLPTLDLPRNHILLMQEQLHIYIYNYHSANSIVFYNCAANGLLSSITSLVVGSSSMRVEWTMKTTGNTVNVATGSIAPSGRRVEIFYG